MKKIVGIGLCCLLFFVSACGSSEDTSEEVSDQTTDETTEAPEEPMKELLQFKESYDVNTPVVVMQTNMGDITIVLFPEVAPKAVENFITHAKDGYYNGMIFHRVINDFMIQSGDPNGIGTGGDSIWGAPFEDEFSDQLYNFRGALSMANSGPNTNGSQFFIVQTNSAQQIPSSYNQTAIDKYNEVGGTPYLDGVHTVFGQVIQGMEVVDSIAAVETDQNDKPVQDVVINNVVVTTYGELK